VRYLPYHKVRKIPCVIYGNLPYGINHVGYGNVRINRALKSTSLLPLSG